MLLGMILPHASPDRACGLGEFFGSFVGGGVARVLAGRALLWMIPRLGDDRLAEGTLTLALAYRVFIVADRLLHVSGVVAVLGSGLTVSALRPVADRPEQLVVPADLWDQIAFWARSLIFVLASILVPRLLVISGFATWACWAWLIAAGSERAFWCCSSWCRRSSISG